MKSIIKPYNIPNNNFNDNIIIIVFISVLFDISIGNISSLVDKYIENNVPSVIILVIYKFVPNTENPHWERVTVKTYYNKLVRDRIPEIIESSGKTCVVEVLSDEEYLKYLDAKLDEELAEYHKDQNIEELADLLEVLRAAAIARGYSIEDLEQVRAAKAEKRGSFVKKLLLKEVVED